MREQDTIIRSLIIVLLLLTGCSYPESEIVTLPAPADFSMNNDWNTATFSWKPVPGAELYLLTVYSNSNRSFPVEVRVASNTNLQLTRAEYSNNYYSITASNTRYYYPAEMSAIHLFELNFIPAPLIRTVSNSYNRFTIEWEPVSNAAYYNLKVFNTTNDSQPLETLKITTNFYQTQVYPEQQFFYTICAVDEKHREGRPSDRFSSISCTPPAPTGLHWSYNPAEQHYILQWDPLPDCEFLVRRKVSWQWLEYTNTADNTLVFLYLPEQGPATYQFTVQSIYKGDSANSSSTRTAPLTVFQMGKPAPPALSVSLNLTDNPAIVLCWPKSNYPTNCKVQIERAAAANGPYTNIATLPFTVTTTTASYYGMYNNWVDLPGILDFSYYYRLKLIDPAAGIVSLPGNSSSDKISLSAPGTPSSTTTNLNITVEWRNINYPEYFEMSIYRSTASNGTYTRCATVPASQYGWADSSITQQQSYYYKLAYFIPDRNYHSGFSSTVSNGIFLHVSNLTATVGTLLNSTRLSWEPPQNTPETITYNIYRDNTLLATTAGTNYTLTGLTNGESAALSVSVICNGSEHARSAAVTGRAFGRRMEAPRVSVYPDLQLTWDAEPGAARYRIKTYYVYLFNPYWNGYLTNGSSIYYTDADRPIHLTNTHDTNTSTIYVFSIQAVHSATGTPSAAEISLDSPRTDWLSWR